jgi:DNA-binding CsgD family transcriptional regulator
MSQSEDDALPILRKSLEQAIHLGLKHLELSNYDNLRLYHADKGNFREAYNYLLKFQALNDSIFNADNATRIAELQTQYDTEIKDRENQLLKDNERLLRLRVLMLSISAAGIAVLATFFIILFHMKRKSLIQSRALLETRGVLHRIENEKNEEQKKHLQAVLFAEEEITRLQKTQLHEKDRELSASTLHIINKNEALNNIRLLASKALTTDDCEGKNCIEKLIHEIDANVNLDEQWDQFKRHFESVHAGFFARLNRQFPDLTQNELKLCAYLRMNLSTKEIAQMLNIEVDSATTKRYRLRKKLKLENDNNLVSFLMDF